MAPLDLITADTKPARRIDEDAEIRRWAEFFGVSTQEFVDGLREARAISVHVRAYLDEKERRRRAAS